MVINLFVRRNNKRKIIRNIKYEIKVSLKEIAMNRCAICQTESSHLEVDHIKPLWEGGIDDIGNLQVLCYECHKIKTANENKKRSKLNHCGLFVDGIEVVRENG